MGQQIKRINVKKRTKGEKQSYVVLCNQYPGHEVLYYRLYDRVTQKITFIVLIIIAATIAYHSYIHKVKSNFKTLSRQEST